MSDDVMVRPVRPYLEGHAIKDRGDDPYQVSRSRALELRGNRLVEWVEPGPPRPYRRTPTRPGRAPGAPDELPPGAMAPWRAAHSAVA